MKNENMKKEKPYSIEFPNGKFSIAVSDFPRTILGKTMYDIHFFAGTGCGNKKAYWEFLEATAKQIIKQVKNNKF